MEFNEFHSRAKQKKHEADLEKEKVKKAILYMEAVCNFFLCAVYQYRHNKKPPANTSSTMTRFDYNDLTNGTISLLK